MDTEYIWLVSLAGLIAIVTPLYLLTFKKNSKEMLMGQRNTVKALKKLDKNSNYICMINIEFKKGKNGLIIPGIIIANKSVYIILKILDKEMIKDNTISSNAKFITGIINKKINVPIKYMIYAKSKVEQNDFDYLIVNTINFKNVTDLISSNEVGDTMSNDTKMQIIKNIKSIAIEKKNIYR